ncbi:hypothetical protein ACFQBQ_05705 [Granulicella cerasi]|uniref:Circularly permuted type 2 ATP-grasp protein n=1 Tax=Granulicella cerasi TaxID=741063 RepID=A0ABW1Z9I9_9BACT|nr:hypothetical protein [Granulicella cerasi]
MIEDLRRQFNASFSPEKYEQLIALVETKTRGPMPYRVAETPMFLPHALLQRMVDAGIALTTQLVTNREYMQRARAAVPEAFRVPGEPTHPSFMAVDFGLIADGNGGFVPKLVEMQAFPSVFGFQPMLAEAYREAYQLEASLRAFLCGEEAKYWQMLREVIVGQHEPQHVALLEVEPESQKTLPDFRVHAERLGIAIVDLAKVVKQGKRLFYRRDGELVRIERIYNRAIVDEIVRKQIALPFDYREELEVEWAGHPNAYFEISKFSLPYLEHETVPSAVFLDDFLSGKGRERLPAERERWVLKPLYSFAGKGITFAPSDEELFAIPSEQRHQYLVQERQSFVPVIATPAGPTQAEVRVLYVWPEAGAMTPMIALARLGRGLMMGVDHNREQSWVGASAVFFPKPL